MALISYDLAEMAAFVADLNTKITALETCLTDARTTVTTLSTHYSGEAADAFTEQQTQWQTTAATYLTELRDLRDHIDRCRQNYADARAANRKMFGW